MVLSLEISTITGVSPKTEKEVEAETVKETAKQQKRRMNRERRKNWFMETCASLGIRVEVFNEGFHLRALCGPHWIDFWPSTATCFVPGRKSFKGERLMLQYLERHKPDNQGVNQYESR